MSNEPRPIAVLKVPTEVARYSEGMSHKNDDVRWLLRNMGARADKEWGIEEVEIAVIADDDGRVYDILLNERSVGFFALRSFVATLPTLRLPEIITHGPQERINIEALAVEHAHGIYVVPLFGEIG